MRSKLANKFNNAVSIDYKVRTSQNLLNFLLKNTTINLNAHVQVPVEDQSKRWNTFSNLHIVFGV